MSNATADDVRADSSRRILEESSPANGGGVDREAILHHRRKAATVSLLSEFEREVERHVRPGHAKEIADFKRSCRKKLNGLTFLACELMKLQPGEEINQHIVDLAEKLQFDANGGQTRP